MGSLLVHDLVPIAHVYSVFFLFLYLSLFYFAVLLPLFIVHVYGLLYYLL